MKEQKAVLVSILVLFIQSSFLFAQRKEQVVLDYIERHKDLAISEMKKHKVPASITLAQGIKETGAGKSELATQAYNHFGIKKTSDWTGKVYSKGTLQYRAYDNVSHSYSDHSLFLVNRPHYKKLFDLDIYDYTSWAIGLKECGYATDPEYARKLIDCINLYELNRYDLLTMESTSTKSGTVQILQSERTNSGRNIFKTNGLIYVKAGKNDSYRAIASDLGFDYRDLINYNDVPENFRLEPGDVVYLEKKHKKADKPNSRHKVKSGESMHAISQFYGIRLSSLYEMNKKDPDYVPFVGDMLWLNK